jgi:hypothetical protein
MKTLSGSDGQQWGNQMWRACLGSPKTADETEGVIARKRILEGAVRFHAGVLQVPFLRPGNSHRPRGSSGNVIRHWRRTFTTVKEALKKWIENGGEDGSHVNDSCMEEELLGDDGTKSDSATSADDHNRVRSIGGLNGVSNCRICGQLYLTRVNGDLDSSGELE